MRWTAGRTERCPLRSATHSRVVAPCVAELCERRVMLAVVAGGVPHEGLVGYWPLDSVDVRGSQVLDRSGRNRNGSLVGNPTIATGRRRQAMQFDGVDDGVNLGNLLATGLTQISAAAWINKTDAVDDGFVIAKASTASPSDPGYGWSLGVAGRTIQVSLQNGAALTTFDGPLVLTKRWYHVAFTYDGATVRIYLNGRQRKAYDYSGGIPASDSPVVIGGGNAAGDAATFGGLIDEVRLYDTPLSPRSVIPPAVCVHQRIVTVR